jgi:hypothetical protein
MDWAGAFIIGILGSPYSLYLAIRDRWRKWRGHPDGPGERQRQEPPL